MFPPPEGGGVNATKISRLQNKKSIKKREAEAPQFFLRDSVNLFLSYLLT